MSTAALTPRRDGALRMTLRVDHHVGREELIAVVASRLELDPRLVPVKPGRRWIANTARDYVWSYGDSGLCDPPPDGYVADAATMVDHAYPELIPRTVDASPS